MKTTNNNVESFYFDEKTRKILTQHIDKTDSTMNNKSAVARKLIQLGDQYLKNTEQR